MFPLSILAKIILFSLGWELLDESIFNQITKYDRSVLVFSHTSYSDFYILILYLLAYPHRLHYVRTLVKPQPFAYAGPLLRKLGAIPSTKIEDRNGGAVKRIIEDLKQWDKCIFLISPKGSIVKREWRSGYYHIAKELNATLMVAGLDYEKKCVLVSPEISHSEGEDKVREVLLEELKKIVPRFPEGEVVKIRDHDETKRGIVNVNRLIKVTITIIIISLSLYLR
jgi:hypothetical protein